MTNNDHVDKMPHMQKIPALCLLALCLLLITSIAYTGESALEATKKIVGQYNGQWTLYGTSAGKVVEKTTWTDVLTAENPIEKTGRSFVEITDVMTFHDGTTRTSKFIEGYFTNPDGSAGDRFYEINGKPVSFKKLSENDWTFHTTLDAGELWFLGFNPTNVLLATQVTTKSTTYDGKIDTDHITRVTTIQWKDTDGLVKSTQFVSMKGLHKRVVK
ncbi:MAG: hypothetical protein HY072_01880 [Deltaproteobacteria bacterium]|nr:hypothetical protein [Deltaproteobacteria bacterium]